MEELKEEIVANIRACLISNKGNCTLRQLVCDYKTLIGTDIEYRKLKFRTLEEFLKSVHSLIVTNVDGQIFVEAKLDERSKHVVELIARQKPPKKKRIAPVGYHKNYSQSPRTRWRPKNVMYKGKTANYYKGGPQEQLVHRQYVKIADKESGKNARVVNNNNAGEILDLRDVLNNKKRGEVIGKVPHSEKTNRSKIMKGIVLRNVAFEDKEMENLKNESLLAVDLESPIWDSWTSSDEGVMPRKKKGLLQFSGDAIEDLKCFAKYHKLPEPSYKIISRSCRYPRKLLFDCKLQIGDQSYSSYPDEFCDESSVKKFVSEKALKELVIKHGKRASLLISNDRDVLDRIPELVKKHYHGIWMWQIEADYTDIYKEILPLNWLEVVDKSPMISVERVSEKRYLLRFCKPEDKGKSNGPTAVADVSVPTNTIDFGEDGIITAAITCVVSAKEVWCRQLETAESEAFDAMVTNLTDIYTELLKRNALRKPHTIVQGGYYVALVDSCWYRVCVFEVDEANVNCFFIDYGDEQLVPTELVFQLEREFAKQQAQAFICRLAGLEELYEVSTNSTHLHNLIEQVVHLETDNIDNDPTASISVVFYDVERGESINQRLISQITIESATPILNKSGATEVYVSHVEPNGDIYLNVPSPGFVKLTVLLQELEASIAETPPDLPIKRITPENSGEKLYFARYKQDGGWYRVRLIDWAPNREYAQIYFVDYGNCDVVKISEEVLYPLDQLSDVISQYPAQAKKVRMEIERVPENFVGRVEELMPPDNPVLLKVIRETDEGVPLVKFFKRIGPRNDLCSVNESINFEEEQRSSRSTPERLQRLISLNKGDAKNVPSPGILKVPKIPKIGEFFDVKIPTAVNPWNFFVQPYDTKEKLNELMTQMQAAYGDVTYSPLLIDDIQPGKIYASKHEDGKWYRTSVMKVIHPGSISVFYCDFGYYANLTLQQLIPLEPQFLELPYQAIKAKLHGIAPKQSKWTMEDCKCFQKLVCRKPFVSIITGIERDELYRCDNVLILKLTDTSTDVDVYIDDMLIRKGIAVRSHDD